MQCSVNDFLFQFTRPRGARPAAEIPLLTRSGFNSRAREGRDGFLQAQPHPTRKVSIHAPARGATHAKAANAVKRAFQFTRPRGARHFREVGKMVWIVSIHAPARGATKADSGPIADSMFQFTRPRGARQNLGRSMAMLLMFQFTRPRGARRQAPRRRQRLTLFQFTRPRGARRTSSCSRAAKTRFNSRAREGRDSGARPEGRERCRFQFTRPRGARRGSSAAPGRAARFQFTRPRGARQECVVLTNSNGEFQFTRPRGARHLEWTMLRSSFSFQFTRPRGARREAPPDWRRHRTRFQFTRPRGARLAPSTHRISTRCFNSRAREGRDTRPRLDMTR